MPIKQSMCVPIFPPGDLDEIFRAVAEIGYPAVETWGRDAVFDEFCETANRHGLRVVSMIGHDALPDGMNKRENHDRIEEELRVSIDIAVEKNIPGVICFSGNRVEGMDEKEGLANTVEGLARSAPYAEEKGVNLNMELLNSKVDHPGYQCDHTSWGVEVIRKVNSPRVTLLYDIYHMQIMEGDIIRTMREHVDLIGHVHTAGNPGRNNLDDEQELNYRGICRALNEAGYDGYMGHEFQPKGDMLAALRQAFETCDV